VTTTSGRIKMARERQWMWTLPLCEYRDFLHKTTANNSLAGQVERFPNPPEKAAKQGSLERMLHATKTPPNQSAYSVSPTQNEKQLIQAPLTKREMN
jgi:hypothetical protein